MIVGCAPAVPPTADAGELRMEADHDLAFAPDVSVCPGGIIEGPGWTIQAVPTPGHTSNHICYVLKEEHALFTGDHVMGWSTTVIAPPDGDMTDYMQSLERIREPGFATLWPTHGAPVREVEPFLAAYAAHRRQRETQILRALGEGPARIRDLVPRLYADVDPRLHPAAARSMLAHMIDLSRRGAIAPEGEAGPEGLYRLA